MFAVLTLNCLDRRGIVADVTAINEVEETSLTLNNIERSWATNSSCTLNSIFLP